VEVIDGVWARKWLVIAIAAKCDVAGDERQCIIIAYYCLGFGNFIFVMEEGAQFEIWGLG
jgi:hypothetical protein